MRLKATHVFLIGIVFAGLVAMVGRYSAPHYLDQQSAIAEHVTTAFEACVRRFEADHPERFVRKKDSGMSIGEAFGITDANGDPIPCGYDVASAARETAAQDKKNAAISKHWSLRIAAVLLFVFAVPFLWQFLLRRVAELGSAFRGKAGGG